ncbi:MAG: hypothetical protein AB8G95_21270 [Anaerolineae bacterium]
MVKFTHHLFILTLCTIVLFGCSHVGKRESTKFYVPPPELEDPVCTIQPELDPSIGPDEIKVFFELSPGDVDYTIIVWQSDKKIYECSNLIADPAGGPPGGFRTAVNKDGEPFRFEIRENPGFALERLIVPIPLVDSAMPEEVFSQVFVRHSHDFKWDLKVGTEIFYHE